MLIISPSGCIAYDTGVTLEAYVEIVGLISICFQRRDVYFRRFNNIVQGSETSESMTH